MSDGSRRDLAHDLVLPTLLFSALGAMSWAVRGSAGAGGMNAHIAPGLIWGTAWWFLARGSDGASSRRYTSGWIILALTAGFAIAGARGWMQWHHFYDGHLSLNYAMKTYVPISRFYGFLWYFIAGSAWAGLPACILAWCSSRRPTYAWQWSLRLACGLGGAYVASLIFTHCPEIFLPLYSSIQDKYYDLNTNASLIKLIRDNGSAIRHVGICLGFLAFEVARRDWKNVVLIPTVGIVTGLGWAAVQNWKWAPTVWPDMVFNTGRCWEVSGGIAIGIGFGLAYYFVNRREPKEVEPAQEVRPSGARLNLEWVLASGLLLLIGWTMFWPVIQDLRLGYAPPVPNPNYLWGYVYLAIGVAYGAAAIARYALARGTSVQSRTVLANLASWGGVGLVLVLGWFIQTQLRAGFNDNVRQLFRGWTASSAIYFAIVVAYCLAYVFTRLTKPAVSPGEPTGERRGLSLDLDWLVTYLGFAVILSASVGDGMTGWFAREGTRGQSAAIYLCLIGVAFGVIYFLKNRTAQDAFPGAIEDPVLERWGAYVGLLYGLGMSLRKGLKGWASLYKGKEVEAYWDAVFWNWVGLGMIICLAAIAVWLLLRPVPRGFRGSVFPHAYGIMWLMLIAENVLAQVVTGPFMGPKARWVEAAFNILYLILFIITGIIVYHYQCMRSRGPSRESV